MCLSVCFLSLSNDGPCNMKLDLITSFAQSLYLTATAALQTCIGSHHQQASSSKQNLSRKNEPSKLGLAADFSTQMTSTYRVVAIFASRNCGNQRRGASSASVQAHSSCWSVAVVGVACCLGLVRELYQFTAGLDALVPTLTPQLVGVSDEKAD